MKRVIALLAACALVTSLAACGSPAGSEKNASAPDEAKQLTWWMPPYATVDALDEEIWAPVIQSFEEKNNCKVEFTVIPWEGYEEKYLTSIAGNAGPDVGYMYVEMYPPFITMGAVADVNSYFTQEEKDNFIAWDSGYIMGGQYGVPFASGDPRVILYNKTILDELGEQPPKTWEDLRRIAKAATQDKDGDGNIDQWGYVTSFADSYYGLLPSTYYPFLWQAGGDIYNEAGDEVIIDSPAGKKSLQFLYDLIHVDKVVPPEWSSVTLNDIFVSHFCSGKGAMTMVSSGDACNYLPNYPDLEWGYVTALEDEESWTFAPTDYLTLMSSSSDPQLSVDLIKHVLSKEGIDRLHEFHTQASPRKDVPYLGSPLFEDAYLKDGGKMRTLNATWEGTLVYDYLLKQIQLIMNDQISIDEGLAEAQQYGNQAIADFKSRNQ